MPSPLLRKITLDVSIASAIIDIVVECFQNVQHARQNQIVFI